MGTPLAWHYRHAMHLAGQLPENPADARLVMQAVTELVDLVRTKVADQEPDKPSNVLPFAVS